MKKDAWMIVANSSIARIFKFENRHSLTQLHVLEHADSRKRNLDIVSDKPGRDFESTGSGVRHGVGTATTPKQHEFEVFAHDLAVYLNEAYNKGKFDSLYLVAAPAFLGLLRQKLNGEMSKIVKEEVNKDLVNLRTDEILSHLPFLH